VQARAERAEPVHRAAELSPSSPELGAERLAARREPLRHDPQGCLERPQVGFARYRHLRQRAAYGGAPDIERDGQRVAHPCGQPVLRSTILGPATMRYED
jgi:hypothetical protein